MNIIKQYQGLRKEIYVLAIGKMITCFGAMVWPMMTLIFSSRLNISASETATYLLIMNVIQIPCLMLSGYLSDRFNKRNIIIICDLVTVISYLIISVFDISMKTIPIFFIAGLFAMMEHPAYDALVADLSHAHQRDKAYSLTYLGANLGMVLSPTIGGMLFENHLQFLFFINSITTLISTILLVIFIKDVTPCEEEKKDSIETQGKIFSFLNHNRLIIFYLLCHIFIEFIYNQYLFLLPLNFDRLYQMQSAKYYGYLTSVNAFIVVVGTPIITSLSQRVSDLNKIFISTFLFMISLSMYIFIQGLMPLYFVSMFIFTCGEIFNALGQQPYLTKHVPPRYRGRVLSIQRMSCTFFVAVAQKGMGILIDDHSMVFMWSFVCVITWIGIFLVFILKRIDAKNDSITS